MGLGPFSSRPVAVSPPFWGWVCFGGLTGVVVHLRDTWRGFPRWVGLLAALLEVYLSIFEQLVSWQGASASTPLFPRGMGRGFLRLAWRYGRRFWRRSLPLPMVFPWRWGHGVRLYLLGWFAILEVLVLKSRVSPFLLVSSLLAWCLEFWAPVPVAPLPRGALWFFSSFCGVRVLHRTSGLVRRSLCSLSTCLWPGLCGFGVIHVWVFSGSPSAVRVLCPLLRRVDVARQDLPCSSVGGLHCPGPVNARQIAWENVFNLV